jgi:hypothetical protein
MTWVGVSLLVAAVGIYATLPGIGWATLAPAIADNLIAFGGGILIADVLVSRFNERRRERIVSHVLTHWLGATHDDLALLGGTAGGNPEDLAREFRFRGKGLEVRARVIQEQMIAFAPFLDVEVVANFHRLHQFIQSILANEQDSRLVAQLSDLALEAISRIGNGLGIPQFDEAMQVRAENNAERDA